MAPFRSGKIKARLRAPLVVRRFLHEQRIRARLSRAGLKKPLGAEPDSAAEINAEQESGERGATGQAAYRAAKPGRVSRNGDKRRRFLPNFPWGTWGTARARETAKTPKTAKTTKTSETPAMQKTPDNHLSSLLHRFRLQSARHFSFEAGDTYNGGPALFLLGVIIFLTPICCLASSRRPFPLYIIISVAFAVFAFYKIYAGKLRLIRSPFDIAVFLLPGLALFSSFGAWNAGEAIGLLLLLSCCAALYRIVSSLVVSPEALYAVLMALTAGAAVTSITCLTAVFQEGRAYPFAAALGIISAAALLFVFYLRAVPPWSLRRSPEDAPASLQDGAGYKMRAVLHKRIHALQRRCFHPALSAAGYLLLLALIGINSKPLFLLLILAIPLSLWKLPAGERKKGPVHFLIYSCAAFTAAGKMRFCLTNGAVASGWMWAAAGLLTVVALEFLPALRKKSGRRLRPWVLPGAVSCLVVLFLFSGGAYLNGAPSQNPPQPSRYDALFYAEEKFLKGRDALRIMVSSPRIFLQGTGGGGWESLSYQYQSFYYKGPPPGAFLQAGVEMGFPGLITLLAVWVFFFKVIKRVIKNASAVRSLSTNGAAWHDRALITAGASWTVFSAALVVGAGSLWACTLTMPAVSLFLFVLFGLGKALEGFDSFDGFPARHAPSAEAAGPSAGNISGNTAIMAERPSFLKKLAQYLAAGCAVLLVITISWNVYAGESYSIAAEQAVKKGDREAALRNYAKAVQRDPLNASLHKELGRLYLENAEKTQNAKTLESAIEQFQKGVRLARGDAELRVLYAGALLQAGQLQEGVRQLETAALLRPLEQEFYEDLALGYLTAGRLLLKKPDQKERARFYLLRARGIPQLLEKRSSMISKQHLRYWSGAPYLGITAKIQLYCGQAAVLLGDKQAALYYLEEAARDASLQAEAESWREPAAAL